MRQRWKNAAKPFAVPGLVRFAVALPPLSDARIAP